MPEFGRRQLLQVATGTLLASGLGVTRSSAEVVITKGRAKGRYRVLDARNRPPVRGFQGLYESAGRRVKADSPHPGWRNLGPTAKTVGTPAFATPEAFEIWMKELDAAGVDTVLANGRHQAGSEVMGTVSTEEMVRLQARYPGKCWALAPVNLDQDMDLTLAEVEKALKAGLRGANLEPGYRAKGGPILVNDPALLPFYEYMSSTGKPVQIQTGAFAGPRLEQSRMEPYDDMLSKFPKLKVVLGHGGYPYHTEMLGCAFKHPNLHLTPDVYMFAPGSRVYQDAIPRLPDQFIFGTAFPLGSIKETLAATLEFDLEPSVMRNYLYNNAARVLGL